MALKEKLTDKKKAKWICWDEKNIKISVFRYY